MLASSPSCLLRHTCSAFMRMRKSSGLRALPNCWSSGFRTPSAFSRASWSAICLLLGFPSCSSNSRIKASASACVQLMYWRLGGSEVSADRGARHMVCMCDWWANRVNQVHLWEAVDAYIQSVWGISRRNAGPGPLAWRSDLLGARFFPEMSSPFFPPPSSFTLQRRPKTFHSGQRMKPVVSKLTAPPI